MKTVAQNLRAFPPQIKYIIGNEACERFSYYGMRSILVIFMINQLKFSEGNAEAVYHLFASACYLLPLLGAYLADRLWGKYRTILYLSLIYCVGHLILSLWETETGLYSGLFLIALGSGGIKPCVSAYVGDQFTEKNKNLLQKVFDLFYWSINFGSFFSTMLIPWTMAKYGSRVAFGIPGILMGIATLLFWMGRKYYIDVPIQSEGTRAGFMTLFFYALRHRAERKKGESFLDVARQKYTEEEVEGAKAVASIVKVFITVSVFWALFDQSGSSWVLQAQKMNLSIAGFQVEAAQMQAINPILVLVLIPLFSSWIYPTVEKMGIRVTPLRKMSVGMLLAGFSFIVVGFLQSLIDSGVKVSVAWQFVPYLIITCSEIMVSITGLEFAYTQAPPAMKSTIMSFWLITVFIGNLLDAYVAKANVFEGAMFFYFFAGLMFTISIIFMMSAAKYKVRNFVKNSTGTLVPA
jgi:proton-dependent oligopeptide transporter, POT family